MKSLSQAKVRYGFPKNVKFHFCLIFWAVLRFYQQFHCKICVWRWYGPNLIFFLVISITLSFQIKKMKFQKFCPRGFLWPEIVNKTLRFCCWYGLWHLINFEQNVSDAWLHPNNSISPIFYGNNHFDIPLIAVKP